MVVVTKRAKNEHRNPVFINLNRKVRIGKRTKTGAFVRPRGKPGTKFLYVVECGGGVKIGISSDPKKRAANMQTSTHEVVRLIYAVPMSDSLALETERSLHRVLRASKFHLRGEWYLLSPGNAIQIVKTAADFIQSRERKRIGANEIFQG